MGAPTDPTVDSGSVVSNIIHQMCNPLGGSSFSAADSANIDLSDRLTVDGWVSNVIKNQNTPIRRSDGSQIR